MTMSRVDGEEQIMVIDMTKQSMDQGGRTQA
jgi:hypothetical protein